MKKCKYCKSEIEKGTKICPVCKKKQGMSKLLIVLVIILVIGIVGAAAGSGNESDKQEKFSYTITSSSPDSANFAYYIEGIVTNNLDKDYSYVQIEFICYDKDGNNLGTALDNTNNLLGKQTWKYKAMGMFTNQTVDHCDFKEVTGW